MAILDFSGGGGRRRSDDYEGDSGGYAPAPTPAPTRTAVPRGTTAGPGYQAPPAPPMPKPPTTQQPFSGDPREYFNSLVAGSGALDYRNVLNRIAPQLQQAGITLQRNSAGDPRGRLFINGQTIDAVSPGSNDWQWIDRGFGGGGTGGFFSDPIGGWFSSLVGDQISNLQNYHYTPGPEMQDVMNRLRGVSGGGNAARVVAPGVTGLNELSQLVNQRVGELQQAPYSSTEEAARRVGAFDNLERSRNVARQQVIERMAALGHAPTSGTVQTALLQVDQSFDALRAQNENQLLTSGIAEGQNRRNLAVEMRQALAQLGLGQAGLDVQAQSANAQAQTAAQGQSLSAMQTLAQLAQGIDAQSSPLNQISAILAAAGLIPALEHQRFQDANSTLLG